MAVRKVRFAQGVTTEIMGEGESMGPLNDRVSEKMLRDQKDIHYEIKWTTLAEYLRYLEARGVSCNVASFIGATTIRENVIGFEDKAPTPQQLDEMRELVRQEMEAGALGIGTSLDLSAGVLCEDGGADRAVQGRGEISGQIHLAHAQRGKSVARSAR